MIKVETNLFRNSCNVELIYRWKVAGALVSPKGVTSYLKSPYCVRKAVFYSLLFFICILWKAAIMSSFVNHFAPVSCRSISDIRGSGYRSFFVILFKRW